MSIVILGCVRDKGWVWIAATGMDAAELFVVEGSDIINGRGGKVRLKERGAGSMTVARAWSKVALGSE